MPPTRRCAVSWDGNPRRPDRTSGHSHRPAPVTDYSDGTTIGPARRQTARLQRRPIGPADRHKGPSASSSMSRRRSARRDAPHGPTPNATGACGTPPDLPSRHSIGKAHQDPVFRSVVAERDDIVVVHGQAHHPPCTLGQPRVETGVARRESVRHRQRRGSVGTCTMPVTNSNPSQRRTTRIAAPPAR